MTPCPVKHPCFFLGGVSRCGPGRRARWPGLACDSSEVASDIEAVASSSALRRVLRTASGGKAFPPCTPRVIILSRVRRVPIGERPLLGPSPREWTPASRCSVRACPSVDGLHPSDPAIGFASLAPCMGAIEVESLRLPPDGRPAPWSQPQGALPPAPQPSGRAGHWGNAFPSGRAAARAGEHGRHAPWEHLQGLRPRPRSCRTGIVARYAWRPGTGRGNGWAWWCRPR